MLSNTGVTDHILMAFVFSLVCWERWKKHDEIFSYPKPEEHITQDIFTSGVKMHFKYSDTVDDAESLLCLLWHVTVSNWTGAAVWGWRLDPQYCIGLDNTSSLVLLDSSDTLFFLHVIFCFCLTDSSKDIRRHRELVFTRCEAKHVTTALRDSHRLNQ